MVNVVCVINVLEVRKVAFKIETAGLIVCEMKINAKLREF